MKKINDIVTYLKEKVYGKKVIVLDLMGTVMDGGGLYPVIKRDGLDEFIAGYPNYRFVIATDLGSIPTKEESVKEVEFYLEQIGLKNKISKIYYGWDTSNQLKDLAKIAKDFHTNINNMVLIGDGPGDEESAKHFGVKFIKVPPISKDIEKIRKSTTPKTCLEDYKNAPDKFSFKDLEI